MPQNPYTYFNLNKNNNLERITPNLVLELVQRPIEKLVDQAAKMNAVRESEANTQAKQTLNELKDSIRTIVNGNLKKQNAVQQETKSEKIEKTSLSSFSSS